MARESENNLQYSNYSMFSVQVLNKRNFCHWSIAYLDQGFGGSQNFDVRPYVHLGFDSKVDQRFSHDIQVLTAKSLFFQFVCLLKFGSF